MMLHKAFGLLKGKYYSILVQENEANWMHEVRSFDISSDGLVALIVLKTNDVLIYDLAWGQVLATFLSLKSKEDEEINLIRFIPNDDKNNKYIVLSQKTWVFWLKKKGETISKA